MVTARYPAEWLLTLTPGRPKSELNRVASTVTKTWAATDDPVRLKPNELLPSVITWVPDVKSWLLMTRYEKSMPALIGMFDRSSVVTVKKPAPWLLTFTPGTLTSPRKPR